MKRGLSYIDWSISVGLFIIFIVSAFILLAPAFVQDDSPNYLTSIIKDGIEKNTSLEMKRIPIFIRVNTTGVTLLESRLFTLNNIPRDLIGVTDKQITLYSENNEITSKDIQSNTLNFVSNLNELNLPTNMVNANASLFLFISPDEIFLDNPASGTLLPVDNVFGVTETIKGISESRFLKFTLNDYETAKQALNYPSQKDFVVEIYNETKINEPFILDYTKNTPLENDEVSLLLWSSWLIHNTTERTPITVLIKVW